MGQINEEMDHQEGSLGRNDPLASFLWCQDRTRFHKKGSVRCKIHFRWIRAIKGKNKAIKPLDEKKRECFHDLRGGIAFLNKSQNPEAIKKKAWQIWLHKNKKRMHGKTHDKQSWKIVNWQGKIFKICATENRLMPYIMKFHESTEISLKKWLS